MLIEVNPGMVLISFSRIFPVPFSRKKSTRASPEHSAAWNAAIASRRTSVVCADGDRGRDQKLGIIIHVFRFVIIELT